MAGQKGRSGGLRPGAGRKPYVPTKADRMLVEQFTAFGLTQEQTRQAIINPQTGKPISHPVLVENFAYELDMGLAKAINAVAGALYTNATVHMNVAAQIFFLKTRAGWKETYAIGSADGKELFPTGAYQALIDAVDRIDAKGKAHKGHPQPAKTNGRGNHL